MNLKKLGKALLFPHIAIKMILIPVSTALLVYSLVCINPKSVVAILSYAVAFYTLTVWCLDIPHWIRFVKTFKSSNRYARIWQDNPRLRMKVSLYGTLIYNSGYALLQLGMGLRHHTFWFYSLAGYYFTLAVMRFFLARHAGKYQPGERMLDELRKYRACGIVFLIMNLSLALMTFFMVYWNRTFHHHEITTIALAAYTFTAFTRAIINMVRYRKYNSPVYSASKAISFASACVSMLTLEATMMTTFGEGTVSLTQRRILLGTSGGVISALIIAMAIYMIAQGTKKITLQKAAKE